jgi:hypothetical protein
MRTSKIAHVTFGIFLVLSALMFDPTTEASASTVVVTATHVTSAAPISVGPSRSECLAPNFDDTGLAALQTAVSNFDTLTDSTVTCLSTYLNGATTWSDWEAPWVTQSQYGYTSWVAEAPQTRQLILQVDLIPTSLEDESKPLGGSSRVRRATLTPTSANSARSWSPQDCRIQFFASGQR